MNFKLKHCGSRRGVCSSTPNSFNWRWKRCWGKEDWKSKNRGLAGQQQQQLLHNLNNQVMGGDNQSHLSKPMDGDSSHNSQLVLLLICFKHHNHKHNFKHLVNNNNNPKLHNSHPLSSNLNSNNNLIGDRNQHHHYNFNQQPQLSNSNNLNNNNNSLNLVNNLSNSLFCNSNNLNKHSNSSNHHHLKQQHNLNYKLHSFKSPPPSNYYSNQFNNQI